MSNPWDTDAIVSALQAPSSGAPWKSDAVIGTPNYKIAPEAMKAYQGKKNVSVVYMSPDQYLSLTPDVKDLNDAKGKSLQASLDKGEAVQEIPSIDISGNGKVVDQDGRHRALAAKQSGVQQIPVAITKYGKGEPTELEGMTGNKLPYDFKVEQPFNSVPMTKAERFGTGLLDPIVGGGQFAAHVMGDKKTAASADQQTKDREAVIKRGSPEGLDWYRTAGNVAATVPMMALSPVLGGAAQGALTPVTEGDFAKEKAIQTATGAAAGKVGEIGANMLGKAIKPTTDVAKKMLLNAGVTLTPGQMAGKVAKSVEEKAKSIPIFGDMVNAGEKRALDSWNVSTVNKALAPLGIVAQGAKTAREAIPFAQQKLRDAYQSVLPRLSFSQDRVFDRELSRVENMADKLPAGRGAVVRTELQNIVRDRLGNSRTMNGEEWKKAESELGQKVDDYMRGDAGDKDIGRSLEDVLAHMRDGLERQNPGAAPVLQSINKGYAMLSRIEDAANRSVTQEGAFTPGQLLMEVKSAAKKAGRRKEYAAGDSLMQDWGEAAQKVIGNKVPDSGTGGRWAQTNLPALTLGAALSPAGLAHTGTGMNMLRRAAIGLPQTRNLLSKGAVGLGPMIAPAASMGANALLNSPQ